MATDRRRIGTRMKNLRKEMNISQCKFAKNLGVTPSCVANWEAGLRAPDVELLGEIAEIFGVTVDYVCCRSNQRSYLRTEKSFERDLHLDISALDENARECIKNYYNFLLKKTP